jgi:hypothetical protein
MAETEYQLKLSLDEEIRKQMGNTNFDLLLKNELQKELQAPQLEVQLKPDTKPGEKAEKDVVLIILAAGFTAGMVGTAVSKVLRTWLNRNRPGQDGSVTQTYEDNTTFKGKGLGVEFEISSKSKG